MADIRAFVCGDPIKHSRSPLIHGYWLKRYKINGSYEAVQVSAENLPIFIESLHENGWAGGNFTIPHKQSVFDQLEDLDDAARAIGAVNTVWSESGKLYGGNTDAYGFAANLDAQVPMWRDAETAIVFGAGGAARAVIFALLKAGVAKIIVVNRTIERAEDMAQSFGKTVTAMTWQDITSKLQDADLLINTTSLGMDGQPDFPLDLAGARADAIASDIVYVPLETPFLLMAKKRGLQTSDGLGMLLHQATPGFEKWFGQKPEVDDALRQVIIDDLGIRL
ncbi:shikimate dehydrogenase [Ahrensia sp. 13_GOM-1096m]|uniref:shikimate dehydrogenase n=1 Tax=Ahrensia sp. 13_GOM-1096m TaxID=1380380 RepID=UPI0004796847|nr:shikimate dehydrogenase [Ahrensia sp. 13_GOM-1096m]